MLRKPNEVTPGHLSSLGGRVSMRCHRECVQIMCTKMGAPPPHTHTPWEGVCDFFLTRTNFLRQILRTSVSRGIAAWSTTMLDV